MSVQKPAERNTSTTLTARVEKPKKDTGLADLKAYLEAKDQKVREELLVSLMGDQPEEFISAKLDEIEIRLPLPSAEVFYGVNLKEKFSLAVGRVFTDSTVRHIVKPDYGLIRFFPSDVLRLAKSKNLALSDKTLDRLYSLEARNWFSTRLSQTDKPNNLENAKKAGLAVKDWSRLDSEVMCELLWDAKGEVLKRIYARVAKQDKEIFVQIQLQYVEQLLPQIGESNFFQSWFTKEGEKERRTLYRNIPFSLSDTIKLLENNELVLSDQIKDRLYALQALCCYFEENYGEMIKAVSKVGDKSLLDSRMNEACAKHQPREVAGGKPLERKKVEAAPLSVAPVSLPKPTINPVDEIKQRGLKVVLDYLKKHEDKLDVASLSVRPADMLKALTAIPSPMPNVAPEVFAEMLDKLRVLEARVLEIEKLQLNKEGEATLEDHRNIIYKERMMEQLLLEISDAKHLKPEDLSWAADTLLRELSVQGYLRAREYLHHLAQQKTNALVESAQERLGQLDADKEANKNKFYTELNRLVVAFQSVGEAAVEASLERFENLPKDEKAFQKYLNSPPSSPLSFSPLDIIALAENEVGGAGLKLSPATKDLAHDLNGALQAHANWRKHQKTPPEQKEERAKYHDAMMKAGISVKRISLLGAKINAEFDKHVESYENRCRHLCEAEVDPENFMKRELSNLEVAFFAIPDHRQYVRSFRLEGLGNARKMMSLMESKSAMLSVEARDRFNVLKARDYHYFKYVQRGDQCYPRISEDEVASRHKDMVYLISSVTNLNLLEPALENVLYLPESIKLLEGEFRDQPCAREALRRKYLSDAKADPEKCIKAQLDKMEKFLPKRAIEGAVVVEERTTLLRHSTRRASVGTLYKMQTQAINEYLALPVSLEDLVNLVESKENKITLSKETEARLYVLQARSCFRQDYHNRKEQKAEERDAYWNSPQRRSSAYRALKHAVSKAGDLSLFDPEIIVTLVQDAEVIDGIQAWQLLKKTIESDATGFAQLQIKVPAIRTLAEAYMNELQRYLPAFLNSSAEKEKWSQYQKTYGAISPTGDINCHYDDDWSRFAISKDLIVRVHELEAQIAWLKYLEASGEERNALWAVVHDNLHRASLIDRGWSENGLKTFDNGLCWDYWQVVHNWNEYKEPLKAWDPSREYDFRQQAGMDYDATDAEVAAFYHQMQEARRARYLGRFMEAVSTLEKREGNLSILDAEILAFYRTQKERVVVREAKETSVSASDQPVIDDLLAECCDDDVENSPSHRPSTEIGGVWREEDGDDELSGSSFRRRPSADSQDQEVAVGEKKVSVVLADKKKSDKPKLGFFDTVGAFFSSKSSSSSSSKPVVEKLKPVPVPVNPLGNKGQINAAELDKSFDDSVVNSGGLAPAYSFRVEPKPKTEVSSNGGPTQ